jgi:hypothetical protein
MPFNAPGSLSEADYWALTAFLMRSNGMPPAGTPTPAAPLGDVETAALIGLRGPVATATLPATPVPVPAPVSLGPVWQVLALVGFVVVIVAGWIVWRRRAQRSGG